MIDRRALIVSAAGSMLTASRVGRAQPARKVYRIGIREGRRAKAK